MAKKNTKWQTVDTAVKKQVSEMAADAAGSLSTLTQIAGENVLAVTDPAKVVQIKAALEEVILLALFFGQNRVLDVLTDVVRTLARARGLSTRGTFQEIAERIERQRQAREERSKRAA